MIQEPLEDCIELNLTKPDHALLSTYDNRWKQYNPSNNIPRLGLSLTSLDGSLFGVPDLDSLRRFNRDNGTTYDERSFTTVTAAGNDLFPALFAEFQVGRSHVLKLERGGHFPWHRDYDSSTFRVIYTFSGCHPQKFIWIEGDRVLPLNDGIFYYINTRKKHCVFSLDTSVFAVFNFFNTDENWNKLIRKMRII